MFLLMYLQVILQHMQTFTFTRFFVIMVSQVIEASAAFLLVLFLFVITYFHMVTLINRTNDIHLFRMAYVLALGELGEFTDLSMTAFWVFLVFTILITVVLMNLVIAILSDKYEEVMS